MLSASLTRLVLANASRVRWHVSADAPETYEALCDVYRRTGSIPVSPVGCERSIYGSAHANMAFRAWHDSLHVAHGLTFEPADEIAVARLHAKACGIIRDAHLIWADVAGQVEYFQRFGEFPTDQTAFVLDYMATGAISRRF